MATIDITAILCSPLLSSLFKNLPLDIMLIKTLSYFIVLYFLFPHIHILFFEKFLIIYRYKFKSVLNNTKLTEVGIEITGYSLHSKERMH